MPSFDDLINPLLTDPPRAAPSMVALRYRVAQRRRRRTTTIRACSIVAVLLMGTAALALPRDRGADVLAGPNTSDTGVGPTVAAAPPDDAPPIDPSSVTLTFVPERASADAARTMTVHNTGTTPYTSCGVRQLRKWDGTAWQPFGWTLIEQGTGTFYVGTEAPSPGCERVAVLTDVAMPMRFFRANVDPTASTMPIKTPMIQLLRVTPGWYELADDVARGRFEVQRPVPTDVDTPPTGNAGTSTTMPEFTADLVIGTQTVDLHPASIAVDAGTTAPTVQRRLPDHAIVVDDDTVSLSWLDPCFDPAHHADISGTPETVFIELSVVQFALGACEPETARYVVTFDLPFAVGGRRLIVMSADTTDQLELTSKPAGSHAGATAGTTTYRESEEELQATQVTTFRQDTDPRSPSLGGVVLRSLACSTAFSWDHFEVDGVTVSQLRQPVPSIHSTGCDESTIAIDPDRPKAFPGLIPPAPR